MASFDSENSPPSVAAAATRYTFRGDLLSAEYPIYLGPNRNTGASAQPNKAREGGTAVLYYINGMMTSPSTHERTSNYLAGIAGEPVIGLYNLTGITGADPDKSFFAKCVSFPVDGIQSAIQYATPIGRFLPAVKALLNHYGLDWGERVVELIEKSWPHLPTHARVRLLRVFLATNLVSTTLLDRLVHDITAYERVVIVAHSQGNLSAGNSLWAITHVFCEQSEPLAKITMIGLASPNPSWPTHGLKLRLYNDPSDFVSTLSVPEVVVQEDRKPIAIQPKESVPGSSHDVMRHMADHNFQRYVRNAVGLKS